MRCFPTSISWSSGRLAAAVTATVDAFAAAHLTRDFRVKMGGEAATAFPLTAGEAGTRRAIDFLAEITFHLPEAASLAGSEYAGAFASDNAGGEVIAPVALIATVAGGARRPSAIGLGLQCEPYDKADESDLHGSVSRRCR